MRATETSRMKLDTEYFRKSNNDLVRRERRIRTVQMRGFHVLAVLAVVAATALLAKQAANFVLHWNRLQVRDFQLLGAEPLDGGRLARLLDRFRGNILAIDLEDLESSLQEFPEVKSVDISRVLPSTLRINFQLRQPRLQHWLDGRWNVLDESGRLIRSEKLPEGSLFSVMHTSAADIGRVIAALPELQRIGSAVEYAAFRQPYGLEVKLRDLPELLYPGEDNVAKKIKRYIALRPRLEDRSAALEYVDMRWEDRLCLGFAQVKEEASEK